MLFIAGIRERLLAPCLWSRIGLLHVTCLDNMWRPFASSWHFLFDQEIKVKGPAHSNCPKGVIIVASFPSHIYPETRCRTGPLPLAVAVPSGEFEKGAVPQDTFLPLVRNM